jgi:hypothetical protein
LSGDVQGVIAKPKLVEPVILYKINSAKNTIHLDHKTNQFAAENIFLLR